MDEQNQKAFKEAVENANLPNFDEKLDKAYERLQEQSRSNIQHTPRQQGPYIVCVSCHYTHTIMYVKPPGKMVGIDEGGMPIIKWCHLLEV